jgi:uncharacterized membrane protein YoaK (UPF0700 family)
MECLIQYLDDLEDFVFGLALLAERIRRAATMAAILAISFAAQYLGVVLALHKPPLALALAIILCVGMLYASATTHHPQALRHA